MSKQIELGITQTLYVSELVPMGVYLQTSDPEKDEKVLLPRNQVPDNASPSMPIEVFIYKDSEDRLIATTTDPFIHLGEVAFLKVVQVTPIGAFLDWGLMKDLLLPFKEQTERVKEGQRIPVALYIDKSHRLCATSHIYDYLSSDSPYKKEEHITGTIYEIIDTIGAFVIIDDKYSALIPRTEICRHLSVYDIIHGRVKEVREDGKLTLSLREKTPFQMDADAKVIMDRLKNANGFLPYHDKSDPELIKHEFQMSKNAFKRAIGRLMKEGQIKILDDGISLKEK